MQCWTVVLRWTELERWPLLAQLRPSPRLEPHVARQLWTRYSVSCSEVMVIRWKRRLLTIKALVVPGSTPLLISRRWLSQHRCLVNFDPCTIMIDYQNSSSSFVKSVQKRDEQTMDSLQPRDQVVDQRGEPDEKRAADSSMVRCRSDHLDELFVPLDDPNVEITEQWQDGLQDWCTCRDADQCSINSARISSVVSQRRSSSNICSCLRRRSASARTTKPHPPCPLGADVEKRWN